MPLMISMDESASLLSSPCQSRLQTSKKAGMLPLFYRRNPSFSINSR
ncbi:hypothetical protein B4113_3159 [Geobacillus sp. B4113_201601]|nr:hypothetical protein B4113_3159 [Geobacillus sp. B4113_201601]